MADPYLPALEDFELNADETAAVEKALEDDRPWDWKPADQKELQALKSAKDKILAYHLSRHSGNCCYCRLNLNGAGPYMTDREHILPKGKEVYKPFSYSIWNLAAACKRCNMQFKRSGDAFVVDPDDSTRFQDSENYRFVHPNFDAYGKHLIRLQAQADTKNIVIFVKTPGSEKATYTHDFFALHELQVDSFDKAQGLEEENLETELAAKVRALAKEFDQ
ncbi:HNH endonuclease [Rhizobium leguminosarum]|uniref:HNH endonuclease n=1 Tax=Rhizobium leguminosarum TaxID=384 RepID=UPI001C98DEC1|nr:HNH endonuclease [Rhizobium leguminosarum]MBY5774933.1 HNH endonuclease [Rhizobium leguminosarum]